MLVLISTTIRQLGYFILDNSATYIGVAVFKIQSHPIEEDITIRYRRQLGGIRLNEDGWVSNGVDHYLLGSNEVRVDFRSVLTPLDSGSCGALKT